MKLLVKLFIYWTIIAIVGIFNNGLNVQAKPNGAMSDVMKMDEPPPPPHEFEPSFARIRRNAGNQNTDERDAPKPEVHSRTRRQAPPSESDVPKGLQQDPEKTRTRRQAPPSESDIPKGLQQDPEKTRAKRQMPAPPPGSEHIPVPFK